MAEARAAGTLYDLGYQRYGGARLGRVNAIRTLLGHSFRTAFGLGRGGRAKFVPVFATAAVFLPAIVSVGVGSATNSIDIIRYQWQLEFTALLLALFTAAQAPELIVTDRQHGVMTLYLSRPLTGVDYIIAKLLALTGALMILTLGPQLLLFLGRILIQIDVWPAFKSEAPQLLPILGGSLLTSFLFASLGMALSSFAAKRAYGSATVVAFFLLMPAIASLVRSFSVGDLRRYALLANPVYLMMGYVNWLFDIKVLNRSMVGRADIPGTTYFMVILGLCAVCSLVLFLRYRKSVA